MTHPPHFSPPNSADWSGDVGEDCLSTQCEFRSRLTSRATQGIPKGWRNWGRLFWVTFFGDAKKVTSCRAAPDGFDSGFNLFGRNQLLDFSALNLRTLAGSTEVDLTPCGSLGVIAFSSSCRIRRPSSCRSVSTTAHLFESSARTAELHFAAHEELLWHLGSWLVHQAAGQF